MSSRPSNSTTFTVLAVVVSLGVLGYCIYGTKAKTIDHKGFKEQKSEAVKEDTVKVIASSMKVNVV